MDRMQTREAAGALDTSDDKPEVRGKRSSVNEPHVASVLQKEVVKGRRQSRDPRTKGKWNAASASPLEGVNATISARMADQ